MQSNEMTPSEAIIILDRLNTEERIDVDRDELRAAIKVAKAAMLKQEKRAVGTFCGFFFVCPDCEELIDDGSKYCTHCGQKIDWRKLNETKKRI